MSDQIVDQVLQKYRSDLDGLLNRIQQLAGNINNSELQRTADSLRRNINEPFLFVVVGEVKAGKSSFVNALLEAEVCATDIEPCTDSIQQIVYAQEKFTGKVDETNVKKIGLPIEILKDISIVDTPGTNTVIKGHEIITERYIPNSDLTFFVLFAKNPYQQSAWNFLGKVNAEWRKKVVFVLQQKDLVKNTELDTNIERVKGYAQQRQIQSPIVFATSAELEFNNEQGNSGFKEIREYIKNIVSSGESYKIKLRTVSQTTQKIIEAFNDDIQGLSLQLQSDRQTAESIKNKIEVGKKRSQFEIDSLVERLCTHYKTISTRIKREFRDSFSEFAVIQRSFVGIFKKNASMQAWIEDFKKHCELELKSSLQETSQEGAQHFVDGMIQLLEGLTEDLSNIKTDRIQSKNISMKILERRQEVVESVKSKVERLLSDEGLVNSLNSNADNMTLEILGGAFATVGGIILTTVDFVVEKTLLDAVGFTFAGVGVVIFAVGIAWQRRRIIKKFEDALDNEQDKFKNDVKARLNQKLNIIYEEVERIFVEFYDYVERQEQAIAPILKKYEVIQKDANELERDMATGLK